MEEDYGAEYRRRVKLAAEASRNCLEEERQALSFEEFKKGKILRNEVQYARNN